MIMNRAYLAINASQEDRNMYLFDWQVISMLGDVREGEESGGEERRGTESKQASQHSSCCAHLSANEPISLDTRPWEV